MDSTNRVTPAAALPAKWRADADDNERCAADARRNEDYERAELYSAYAFVQRRHAEALDAALHAQAEPPAPNQCRCHMNCGSVCTTGSSGHHGWCKEPAPAPSSATNYDLTSVRFLAENLVTVMERGLRSVIRPEDWLVRAQNLRDAIAAVQGSGAPEPSGDRALRNALDTVTAKAQRHLNNPTADRYRVGYADGILEAVEVVERALPALPGVAETPTDKEKQ